MSHPTVRSPRSPVAVALRGGFPLLAVVTVLPFPGAPATAQSSLLVPQQVFDGEALHEGWVVLVSGGTIQAAGPAGEVQVPGGTEEILLPETTLLPGLIEGHSHLLLHPLRRGSVGRPGLVRGVGRAGGPGGGARTGHPCSGDHHLPGPGQ